MVHEPLEYREADAEAGHPDLDVDTSYEYPSRMRERYERLPDAYLRWRREDLLDRAYPAFVDEIPHDYGGPRENTVSHDAEPAHP